MAETTRRRKNKAETTRERKREAEVQRGKAIRQWRRRAGGVVEAQCWAASDGEHRGRGAEEDEDTRLVGNCRSVFL
jgi:hypothetical protein